MIFQRVISGAIVSLFLLSLAGGLVSEAQALTAEEEKIMGKKIILEIEGKAEFIRDVTVQAFIERIGRSLGAYAGPNPFDLKFYVVKGQDPNAIAIPGGHILVTTGLIVLAENEHEIAGVIGHEIAHITGRHVAHLMDKMKTLSIVSLAAMIAGAIAGGGGAASQAVAATAMATTESLALKFTREMEQEADQNGLHILTRSGYDPNGLLSFLNRMNRVSLASMPKVPTHLLTHPETETRIAFLQNLIQIEPKPGVSFKPEGDFRRIQARVFVEEREPHVAVSHFESLIKADPGDVNGYLGLAFAFQKMGRLDKSAEVFQHALSISPGDREISREIGVCSFLSGNLDQAIQIFEGLQSFSGVRNSGEDLKGLFYLAKTYQEKEDVARALPLFLRFRKEMPDFPGIENHLGSVYGRMGKKGVSHLCYGRHFKSRGDRENALLHFGTALKWLEKGSPEREEVEQELKDLTKEKKSKK
jgi:beta-barrel assembly-enhancing protease